MRKIALIICAVLAISNTSVAQQPSVKIIDPPFWWAGMPVKELQLQLYVENLGDYKDEISYPGIEITEQIKVDSPNYLFLYLTLSEDVPAGTVIINLSNGSHTIEIEYELKPRQESPGRQGFDASDVIYLMMPDRFANGNPDNDSIEGMLEAADRNDPNMRQGGDIQGIMYNLDYIQELGMTAIWFTPVFENDMSPDYGAYHGYAATDLYKVDRRFGSNEEYKALVDSVHARGMKVIMDMIHNHVGDRHWWMDDLPTKDWVHDFDTYGQTNFRGIIVSDPYASQYDLDKLQKGWFVPEMPDLNQKNNLLSDYLIQNTLWWIEYSGIDGIRMDTYVYPDKEYMARWAKEVLAAYPGFNIVGEAWVEETAHAAYWQYDEPGQEDGYNSNLPSITDFPLSFAIRDALMQEFTWRTGLSYLHNVIAQDHLYTHPMGNVVFLDNHDTSRIFHFLNEDKALFKMAYAFLMTTRGIPQVYYGTELMMGHDDVEGDEAWRQTMPGGWPDDERSVFTQDGRTDLENEIFDYVSALTNWRKTAVAIHEGRLIHFMPVDNVYVFFRVHRQQTIMVVMNANEDAATLSPDRYKEILAAFSVGKNVLDNTVLNVGRNFTVPAKTTSIFELQ